MLTHFVSRRATLQSRGAILTVINVFAIIAIMNKITDRLKKPFLLKVMLWKTLPGLSFFGIKVTFLDGQRSQIDLPYRWRSQNPFKSIYFAAQCAAAEFASGVLVLTAVDGRKDISMLVASVEGKFVKKADQTISFHCAAGQQIADAIEQAIATGEAVIAKVMVEGRLPDDTIAAYFVFEWTFKQRNKAFSKK
jgi:Domain of unknown function (DUF4442)